MSMLNWQKNDERETIDRESVEDKVAKLWTRKCCSKNNHKLIMVTVTVVLR